MKNIIRFPSHLRTASLMRVISLLLAISLVLGGCGRSNQAENTASAHIVEDRGDTWGLTPEFSYEVPLGMPRILVDRVGYLSEETKTAIILGEDLPDSFEVIEKESGKVCFSGPLFSKNGANEREQINYGVFSDLKEEGTYYIRCKGIGCSDYFSIGYGVYAESARGLWDNFQNSEFGQNTASDTALYLTEGWKQSEDGTKDTVISCQTVSYLLMAYEVYPELCVEIWNEKSTAQDTTGTNAKAFFAALRTEINWLLSMQEEDGGVYAGLRTVGHGVDSAKEQTPVLQEINDYSTAVFAGTLARYSYLSQQIDMEFATICLKAASKAWKYLENRAYSQTGDELLRNVESRLYGAAELYRASNDSRYSSFIQSQYAELVGQNDIFLKTQGEYTYLSCRRKVNNTVCEAMMTDLLRAAEKLSKEAREGNYLVCEGELADKLERASAMSVVNYVITNHEYTTVIENQIHYLLGRNETAKSLIPEMDQKSTAQFLLLLSMVNELHRENAKAE